MYTVEIKLDIMLSSKASSNQQFKIVVAIQLMKLDDGTVRWGHLGQHDYRMPKGGNFSKDGGDIVLKSMDGKDFARLTNFPDSFRADSAGAIKVYDPEKRNYPGQPIQWRGSGKWTFLRDKTPPSTSTWNHLCNNFKFLTPTEWYISSCYGFSLAGGAGGYGGEYLQGTIEFMNEVRPNDPPFKLNYKSLGGGFMTPGVGGSYAPSFLPTLGSYVVHGTLPADNPFHPRQLTGQCVIVDGSAGVTGNFPLPKGAKVPVPAGGGGALTMFLFGTLGGVGSALFTSYKAGAVAFGGAVSVSGKSGPSLAATLSFGTMNIA